MGLVVATPPTVIWVKARTRDIEVQADTVHAGIRWKYLVQRVQRRGQ